MRAVFRMDLRVQARLIAPESAHLFLRIDVSLVIGEEKEGIVAEQVLDDRTKQFRDRRRPARRWR